MEIVAGLFGALLLFAVLTSLLVTVNATWRDEKPAYHLGWHSRILIRPTVLTESPQRCRHQRTIREGESFVQSRLSRLSHLSNEL